MTQHPIAYCKNAASKITGTLTLEEIVRLMTQDEDISAWTAKARHIRLKPDSGKAAMTYADIKLNFLPQILPNAIFTGASKAKAAAGDGSPWCLAEWDNLEAGEVDDLIGLLLKDTKDNRIRPIIASETLSGNGVWALFLVDPDKPQVFNGRAVSRHCTAIQPYASRFDKSSVLPCQGRTLCHSGKLIITLPDMVRGERRVHMSGFVFYEPEGDMKPVYLPVIEADRWVDQARTSEPPKDMSAAYRKACVKNTVTKLHRLSEGERNKKINAFCFGLHKTIGKATAAELADIEAACAATGIPRDELAKITGLKRLRGVA